ncbi:hypothetical protein CFC21_052866 [Triticum aestivum]|uniref:Prolamin-like domain-containing protein n=3 Tax=Triticum TaxID=4564 RepID=A0A3B6HXR1_WHEAT|nr:egg cell-secreted protein 1.2-like [Triticum dicoccoides]XP_044360480.1 egg cell-secreted protein 1.2-like [Triticum aestivum]XP_048573544.1 egg cell-secreted protein 1.2-like [Triticum urartu]KAF7043529.1 hypothetical protein CFC21_052866 [Triticum aestivum]
MAPVVKFVVAALLVLAAIAGPGGVGVASATTGAAGPAAAPSPAPLVARLRLALSGMAEEQQGGGWMMECWGAVTELRSCTSEIVLFFLNGESYLGRDCCIAIRTVTLHCWPSMLASIGLTAQEADILRGFCDAEIPHAPPPPAPAAVPAPAAQP